MFLKGFIIGAVTEFIILLIIARKTQKDKEKEILKGEKNDKN